VWWNVYIGLYSKFPAESVSERVFKIGWYLTKLLPKVWWLPFWNTVYNSAFLHGRHLCFGSHIGFEKCHPTILRSLWYPNSESTDNLLLTNIIHKSNFNYITAYTRTLCRGYITSTTKQSLIDFCTINWLFCSVLVVTTSATKLICGACKRLAQLFYCSFIVGVVTTSLQERQKDPPTLGSTL